MRPFWGTPNRVHTIFRAGLLLLSNARWMSQEETRQAEWFFWRVLVHPPGKTTHCWCRAWHGVHVERDLACVRYGRFADGEFRVSIDFCDGVGSKCTVAGFYWIRPEWCGCMWVGGIVGLSVERSIEEAVGDGGLAWSSDLTAPDALELGGFVLKHLAWGAGGGGA